MLLEPWQPAPQGEGHNGLLAPARSGCPCSMRPEDVQQKGEIPRLPMPGGVGASSAAPQPDLRGSCVSSLQVKILDPFQLAERLPPKGPAPVPAKCCGPSGCR